ncbi:DM domain-containing protein [Aphelenchoides besseyi]|nr:DM domain-containing protein [Aphelenchoides besseyi]
MSETLNKDRRIKFCTLCRQHNLHVNFIRHDCPFSKCDCPKCTLIRHRRRIMSRQIQLTRQQQRMDSDKPTAYHCQRCRNHGVFAHSGSCPHRSCRCDLCNLIANRRLVDREIVSTCERDVKPIELNDSKTPRHFFLVSNPEPSKKPIDHPVEFAKQSESFKTFCLVQNKPPQSTQQLTTMPSRSFEAPNLFVQNFTPFVFPATPDLETANYPTVNVFFVYNNQ